MVVGERGGWDWAFPHNRQVEVRCAAAGCGPVSKVCPLSLAPTPIFRWAGYRWSGWSGGLGTLVKPSDSVPRSRRFAWPSVLTHFYLLIRSEIRLNQVTRWNQVKPGHRWNQVKPNVVQTSLLYLRSWDQVTILLKIRWNQGSSKPCGPLTSRVVQRNIDAFYPLAPSSYL